MTKKSFVKTVTRHVRRFLKKCDKDNVSALAGQSAFFILLSAVPLMMFAFTMVSLLTGRDPSTISFPEVKSAVGTQLEPYVNIFTRFIEESIRHSGSGTAIVTAVVTLWSAGKGMYFITEGISRIYTLPKKKIWLVRRIYAMGYTVVLLLMLLICVAAMALAFLFAGRISLWWKGMAARRVLFFIAYIGFMLLQALLMTLALKFYLLPKLANKRRCTVRALFPGMVLTVIAWNGLTFGMLVYIFRFATSSIYGSLGSVFLIMIWVYFMMYILLYGIQLDYLYRYRFSCKKAKRRKKKPIAASKR